MKLAMVALAIGLALGCWDLHRASSDTPTVGIKWSTLSSPNGTVFEVEQEPTHLSYCPAVPGNRIYESGHGLNLCWDAQKQAFIDYSVEEH